MLDVKNQFGVALVHERVVLSVDASDGLTREAALNLAAWILAVSDAPLAFEHVTFKLHSDEDAVLSAEFVELLAKVQQS